MSEATKPTTRNRGQRRPPRERFSPPVPSARPIKRKSATPPSIEEPPPVKQKTNPLLPTSTEKQHGQLPSSAYQSLAESGVLATSLKQSMERLRSGWLFEKYWTKSVRKKNHGDAPNPDSKSMHKLGVCSMSIEPHVFEVTLYTVKGSSVTVLPLVNQHNAPMPPGYYHNTLAPAPVASRSVSASHPPPLQPSPAPTNHSTPLQPSPMPPSNASSPPAPVSTSQSLSVQATVPSQLDGTSDQSSLSRVPNATDPPASTTVPEAQRTLQPQQPNTPRPSEQTSQAASSTPTTQPTDMVSSTNPVIQMLAQRASADPNLKSLMKIVANGTASPDEVRTFQRHIDELNSIIKGTQPPPNPISKPVPNAVAPSYSSNHSTGRSQTQTWSLPLAPIKKEPLSQYYSQQPHYSKPKAPVAPKPDVSAIVFDFSGGNGDRYLIPKKSILEFLPGSPQVLISFLVTRRGSDAEQGSYKTNVEYYQPITVKLSCLHRKVLEPLARAVDPPDIVRNHMDAVMAKATRAEDIYLVTQLPRGNAAEQLETLGKRHEVREDVTGSGYSPPNSLLPLRPALVK